MGIVIGILSITPSVESDAYIKEVYPNRNQVLTSAFFQVLLVPVYVGFALILYPVLASHSKTLSIGFVGFRFMAATFQIVGVVSLPVLVFVCQKYTNTGLAVYEPVGDLIRWSRDLVNHLGVMLATGLGNVLFYTILYQHNMVPKWLSFWAFGGNALVMLAGVLIMFQLVEVVSITYGLMSIPLVVQEVVLATWLLKKGLATNTEPL